MEDDELKKIFDKHGDKVDQTTHDDITIEVFLDEDEYKAKMEQDKKLKKIFDKPTNQHLMVADCKKHRIKKII